MADDRQVHLEQSQLPAPPLLLTLTLIKVTSVLVFSQRSAETMTGTPAQLLEFAGRIRRHNLLLGWWGVPFGLIWTPLTLRSNAKLKRQLQQQADAPAPADWYADPTDPTQVRFWDGAGWTDRVTREVRQAL